MINKRTVGPKIAGGQICYPNRSQRAQRYATGSASFIDKYNALLNPQGFDHQVDDNIPQPLHIQSAAYTLAVTI